MVRKGNVMDNYIVINGKKAELTDEQLKQLGINIEKETPFTRKIEETYYSIGASNAVQYDIDNDNCIENVLYEAINYFNDEKFAQQVALHQLLYRKLLKYAYENDAFADDWTDPNSSKYFIIKHTDDNKFCVDWNRTLKHSGVVYFTSEKVTEQAFEDVVKPFMKEHPEFVW